MNSTPGSHVVLVGAGVSRSSGIRTAWEVLTEEAARLAGLYSEEDVAAAEADIEGWYQEKFGKPLRYEELLEELAPKQLERQQRLRNYFEPSAQDWEAGRRQPTAAHHALAELVAGGFVKVVVTLNFDHLIEMALRDRGIQPLVVRSAEQLGGLPALQFLPPVVVHLHGDYTAAGTMRNTDVELKEYPEPAVRWLERLFGDHGLIAVGWSAAYDNALVEVFGSVALRPFTSFWIEPFDMCQAAAQLVKDFGFVPVRADADTALDALATAVVSLRDRPGRHPLALDVAVASAKRELSRSLTPVAVHDALRAGFVGVRELPELNRHVFEVKPGETVDSAFAAVEKEAKVATALLGTVVYWSDERSDNWWLGEVQRLVQPNHLVGGTTALIRLLNLPGLMFFYMAGVAALAARRPALVGRLFSEVTVKSPRFDAASL